MSQSLEARRAYRAFERCNKLESEERAARRRIEEIAAELPEARKEARDCAAAVNLGNSMVWDVEQVGRLRTHYCDWFFRTEAQPCT